MLVSFITPVCNQGDEARETVASARAALAGVPHEIIVVDDHSVDGSCHGMSSDVLIVRTERREGVSSARRRGFAQSRGDILIWSDPHCRFPPDSLKYLAERAASEAGIYQPRIAPSECSRVRSGGQLAVCERGLRVQRAYRTPARFPALYGTVYALRRDVYEQLGGWPKLPGIWSYSEQALTLMAWFLKVPIVVDEKHVCIHKSYHEGKRFPFSVHQSDIARNAYFVHAVFFPKTFESFWRPLLKAQFGQLDEDGLKACRSFQRIRRHLDKHSVRTEEQFFHEVIEHAFPENVRPVVYRENAPSGNAYVRQQSRRSQPKDYLSMRPRVDAALDWMARSIPKESYRGKCVIDVGTRDGYGTQALASLGAGGVEGIELVPATAEFARSMGRPVRQGDMTAMPHPDRSADVITCIHALEHVPKPVNAIRELGRVLRPGGWLFVVVPEDKNSLPENDVTHNCHFPTFASLRDLILQTGLFAASSVKADRGALASGRRELRLVVQRSE